MITATRKHEICAAHRLVGHNGACERIHGHNYLFEITLRRFPQLSNDGMVVDFAIIKNTLCRWLDDNWDHKLLLWQEDVLAQVLSAAIHGDQNQPATACANDARMLWRDSLCLLEFNPTAENMAHYLLHVVFPKVIESHPWMGPVEVISVLVQETGKCFARADRV